ncbi:MAG: TetR/AcrR family transcriptional regulator [Pseudomonadota bacterium]
MSEDPKPKRGRPKRLDAEKTLRTAMSAYWEADPADVSVNQICTLADVSKPALYREFGGEDGLMLAVLELYAEEVLSDIFGILQAGAPFSETLEALTDFASINPKMSTGCVFFKMRAGKHRLGPRTLDRANEIEAAAVQAFTNYLEACTRTGAWRSGQNTRVAARFMLEQLGLALMQRGAGQDPSEIKETLTLAFSVLT